MINSLMIALTLFSILIGIWLKRRKKIFSYFKELGIPGPEPNLIFGNYLEILKKTQPECEKEWIQKYGKVVGYYFGAIPVLKIADVELAKKIMVKDFQNFSDRPVVQEFVQRLLKDSLIFVKGQKWKETRSIITPTFTASKLKMLTHLMNSATNSFLESISAKCKANVSFNIHELYQKLTMDVIGRSALGIQTDIQSSSDDHVALKASRAIVHTADTADLLTIIEACFPEFGVLIHYFLLFLSMFQSSNPSKELKTFTQGVVQFRKNNQQTKRQDLLQLLMDSTISRSEISKLTDDNLAASADEPEDKLAKKEVKTSSDKIALKDPEVLDNALLFLLAGFETTSAALGFTTHYLVNYPDVQDKARKEIEEVLTKYDGKLDYNSASELKYLEQVITESLRLLPPVHLFVSRVASDDIEYGSYKIKKGLCVEIAVIYINRDPDLWENPDEFNPDRFSPENKSKIHSMAFQSFGQGPRNCVGMRFAYLEMKLALANILRNFKLVPTKETEMGKLSTKFNPNGQTLAKGVTLKVEPV